MTIHSAFKAFAVRLSAKQCADAGWDSRATDGHLDSVMRATLLRMQAQYSEGDSPLLTEARRRFNLYVANPSNVRSLPAGIIVPMFKLVLRESHSNQEYETLMNLYHR